MSNNNFSRVPVRFLTTNQDLLKAQAVPGQYNAAGGTADGTDYKLTEETASLQVIPDQYRAPLDRVNGNEMARRYPDGTLDIDYMKHKIIDALRIVKDQCALNAIQELALSVLFPTVFVGIYDPTMADTLCRVNLKITPHERDLVAMAVAEHLIQEHELLLHRRQ